jgi:hypothetical protein
MTRFCPQCGSATSPAAAFCAACGVALGGMPSDALGRPLRAATPLDDESLAEGDDRPLHGAVRTWPSRRSGANMWARAILLLATGYVGADLAWHLILGSPLLLGLLQTVVYGR